MRCWPKKAASRWPSPMTRIDEAAPAKVNLTLHVTGRRDDGYHLLDSLVVFADIGDRIHVETAPETTFRVTGPRAAGVPTDSTNLVLRAAALFGGAPVAIILDKHLPAASGIGGGSADAAATLRALARLDGVPLPEPDVVLTLGADVPVCLKGRAVRMGGIGERLGALPTLPPLPALLVNPGVEISTPEVFRRLARRDNPPMAELPAGLDTPKALAEWLATQRNDLEAPARSIAPQVGEVLERLAALPSCMLSRMSGSGATCFGLFPGQGDARRAAEAISAERPDWWVVPTMLS